MVEKRVKTRTPHKCSMCEQMIPAGTIAHFAEFRDARFDPKSDDPDKQIGIQYFRGWIHHPCCDETPM